MAAVADWRGVQPLQQSKPDGVQRRLDKRRFWATDEPNHTDFRFGRTSRLPTGNADRFLREWERNTRSTRIGLPTSLVVLFVFLLFYCGNATFWRRALTRGSLRSSANSGVLRALPIRTAPRSATRFSASRVRSLSP